MGAVGGKSRGPRQRSGAGSLVVAQASRHSLSWFRGQSFQTLCGRDSEPHCGGKRHRHRWGPGVRIHFVDVGKLQFLSEFGEICSFIASDKGVVFLDHHDTQQGEARITCENGDLYQLASLSLPTHKAELVADLSNLAPQVFHDTATALFGLQR